MGSRGQLTTADSATGTACLNCYQGLIAAGRFVLGHQAEATTRMVSDTMATARAMKRHVFIARRSAAFEDIGVPQA